MTQPQAGHELDALIAERVMGWTVAHYPRGRRVVGYSTDHGNYYETVDGGNPDGVKRSSLGGDPSYWSPSCDIASAFLVVEKMRERGFMFRTNATADDAGAETWAARFWALDYEGDSFEHWAPTAAHAICLAALAALEANEKTEARPS